MRCEPYWPGNWFPCGHPLSATMWSRLWTASRGGTGHCVALPPLVAVSLTPSPHRRHDCGPAPPFLPSAATRCGPLHGPARSHGCYLAPLRPACPVPRAARSRLREQGGSPRGGICKYAPHGCATTQSASPPPVRYSGGGDRECMSPVPALVRLRQVRCRGGRHVARSPPVGRRRQNGACQMSGRIHFSGQRWNYYCNRRS